MIRPPTMVDTTRILLIATVVLSLTVPSVAAGPVEVTGNVTARCSPGDDGDDAPTEWRVDVAGQVEATWNRSDPAPPGTEISVSVNYSYKTQSIEGGQNDDDTYMVPLDGVDPDTEATVALETNLTAPEAVEAEAFAEWTVPGEGGDDWTDADSCPLEADGSEDSTERAASGSSLPAPGPAIVAVVVVAVAVTGRRARRAP